jgi:uncharacterized protein DUF4339
MHVDAVAMTDEWHVLRDNQQYGPYPYSALVDGVRRGLIARDDFVWRPGWENWHKANTVAGLFSPPSLNSISRNTAISNTNATVTSAAKIATKPLFDVSQKSNSEKSLGKRRNYFIRHWRGELSLPISYWINNILSVLLIYALAALLGAIIGDGKTAGSASIAAAYSSYFLAALAISLWQMIGVWRSATHHPARGGKAFWAGLAKLMVIVGAIRMSADFANTFWPIISEHVRISLGDDRFGTHRFRLLRDGTELEFSGGINVGVAKEFAQMLDAASQVHVLHLNSMGGRIAEADLMASKVRQRGLTTYVSEECDSACTHIFLAGKERWISDHAKVGFHRPDFPGLKSEDVRPLVEDERRLLLSIGLPADFVTKALTTSSNAMWRPTATELAAAHVISGVVDNAQFAASGQFASLASDSDRIAGLLTRIPVYAALQRADPNAFSGMLQELSEGYKRGATEEQIFASARAIFAKALSRYWAGASDDTLLQLSNIYTTYMSGLRTIDPESCVALVDNSKDARMRANLAHNFPENSERELALYEVVMSAGIKTGRPLLTEAQATQNMQKIFLSPAFGKARLAVFSKSTLLPSEYEGYCEASFTFYKEINKLPKQQALDLLRYLFAAS